VEWREKVVVVTGASSGIGEATAEVLAERGAVVVAVARRQDRLERLVQACREHSPRTGYLAGDLGERSFAERVIDETVERHGRIDVLVNNAGISKHKQIYHATADEVERVMAVNFLSCVWTTFAAVPHMLREGGGAIVNVSSIAGEVVPPREAIYGASKAAMNAFTEGLWNDLEGSGIHAALVIPGPIETEIWEKTDEPTAFDGKKVPASLVADAILEVVEKRRRRITVPRRRLDLNTARLLHFAFPRLLRMGMRRMDPVAPEVVEGARERARRGKRLGDLGDDPAGPTRST
jgi:short-subunit dehydrogenase